MGTKKQETELSTSTKTVLELDNFNPMREELEAFANKRKGFKIKDFNDKEGYELLKTARIELKNKAVEIEKERKRIVAQPNKFVSTINDEAKVLTKIIKDVENTLVIQEKEYNEEKARIKKEKEEAEQKIVQDRLSKFAEYNYHPEYIFTKMLSDEQFETMLEQAKTAFIAKKEKEKEEKEAAEKQAKELELQRKQQAEEQEKLRKEKEQIEKDKIEIALQKIPLFESIQELNNYFNSFADNENIQDKIYNAYEAQKSKLFKKIEQPTKAEPVAPKTVTKEQVKQDLTAKEKKTAEYKQFLFSCGITEQNAEDFEIYTDKEAKTVTVKKIVGVFNF